eukprot:11776-Prorocentrum_minimum.AAC.1
MWLPSCARYQGSTRTCGVRKHVGEELNSPVVKWHPKGLMGDSQLWRYFGVYCPAAEWLNKGLTSVWILQDTRRFTRRRALGTRRYWKC